MNFDPRKIRLLMELRTGGVSDTRVLGALEKVPRELFVDPQFKDQAYDNIALPIGQGQTISQPLVVANMLEALNVQPPHKVLEIGTGSGYLTALLAHLCRRVYTVELHRALMLGAQEKFKQMNLSNIVTKIGDGHLGWIEQKPFERIIVSAASPEIPPALLDQLAEGGIMIIPLGPESRDQQLCKIVKTAQGYDKTELYPVRFVPFVDSRAKPDKRKIS